MKVYVKNMNFFYLQEKDKNYTVMSNYHFKDKRLSLRAKGLLYMMLYLQDEWTYSLNGLNSICTERKITIRNIIKELKEFHYLDVTEKRRENGKIYYEYTIYEKLLNNPRVHFLSLDLPYTVF